MITMELITFIVYIAFGLVTVKAVIIGSDFSFILWFRYGKKYRRWYVKRPTNEDFEKENKF